MLDAAVINSEYEFTFTILVPHILTNLEFKNYISSHERTAKFPV